MSLDHNNNTDRGDNEYDDNTLLLLTSPMSSPNRHRTTSASPSSPTPTPLSPQSQARKYVAKNDPNLTFFEEGGKPRWKCGFCHSTFAWNPTKVVLHFARQGGNDIKPCSNVSEQFKGFYNTLYAYKMKQTKEKNAKAAIRDNAIDRNNIDIAAKYEQTRKRPKLNRYYSTPMTGTTSSTTKNTFQLKLTDRDTNLETRLTSAIADFIFSCGLSFGTAEHPMFKKVILLAKHAGTKYVPPNRKLVSTVLLDISYQHLQESQLKNLTKQAHLFGLSMYGDGATVHRMPLLNILASGVFEPAAVLDIVDATEHLQGGGTKDATYIANITQPYIDQLEKMCPNSVDYLSFDGAGNVQKAGRILAAKYPRIVVTHGAEHVISLFFHDCFTKLPLFSSLHKLERKIYQLLSGGRHTAVAVFKDHVNEIYHQRGIGLFRPAGTRMAGNAIALMRALRLREAIISTTNSPHFKKLKVILLKQLPTNNSMHAHISHAHQSQTILFFFPII